jgi:hypothetical protein
VKKGLRGIDSSKVEVPGIEIASLPGTETILKRKEGLNGKGKKEI